MYAVVEEGGKQYRLEADTKIKIQRREEEVGSEIKFDKVISVVKDDGTIAIGTPYVEGASVEAKILEHGKGKKVVAFHYKPKKRIRIKRGHRQPFTKVAISVINA